MFLYERGTSLIEGDDVFILFYGECFAIPPEGWFSFLNLFKGKSSMKLDC